MRSRPIAHIRSVATAYVSLSIIQTLLLLSMSKGGQANRDKEPTRKSTGKKRCCRPRETSIRECSRIRQSVEYGSGAESAASTWYRWGRKKQDQGRTHRVVRLEDGRRGDVEFAKAEADWDRWVRAGIGGHSAVGRAWL